MLGKTPRSARTSFNQTTDDHLLHN